MTVEEWTQLVNLLYKAWNVSEDVTLPDPEMVFSQGDLFFAAMCEAEKRMNDEEWRCVR